MRHSNSSRNSNRPIPTVSPTKNSLEYFCINRLQRLFSMERASRGGEKRTAVWASYHEEQGSDGAVAPPMCAHRLVLHHAAARQSCPPPSTPHGPPHPPLLT